MRDPAHLLARQWSTCTSASCFAHRGVRLEQAIIEPAAPLGRGYAWRGSMEAIAPQHRDGLPTFPPPHIAPLDLIIPTTRVVLRDEARRGQS